MKILFTKNYAYIATLIGLLCIALVAETASAQEYIPLAGIPGVTSGSVNLTSYINALFLLSISLGAMIGVIKIGLGGFKYMMSEVVTSKEDARKDITGALIGLGILLSTFVVLYAINPELVNMNAFRNADKISIPSNPNPTGNNTNQNTFSKKYAVSTLTEAQELVDSCNSSGSTGSFQKIADGEFVVTCSSTTKKVGADLTQDVPKNDEYKEDISLLKQQIKGFSEAQIVGRYTLPSGEFSAKRDFEIKQQCPFVMQRFTTVKDPKNPSDDPKDVSEYRYYCIQ